MRGRLLGIDYGRRRIGVATCDELGISVNPYGHIDRENDDQAAQVVAALVVQEAIDGIVLGMPFHAHGDEGQATEWVKAFITVLEEKVAVPIETVDERYTSAEAEGLLRSETGREPRRGAIDAKAAALILRRYLDRP